MKMIDIPAHQRVVFVCEKRHQSEMTARAWAAERGAEAPPTWLISLGAIIAGERALPRDVSISSLPRVVEPRLTRHALPYLSVHKLASGMMLSAEEGADEVLRTADHIICACDEDARGAGMFRDFVMTRLGIDPLDRPFLTYFPRWYGGDAAALPFRQGRTTLDPDYRAAARVAEARRFFDHNWALNAIPLIGKAYREAGGAGNPFISKYSLQALYALRRAGPLSDGDALLMMGNWRGTGRYEAKAYQDVMGSASSRGEILDGLRQRGLVGPVSAVKGPRGTTWLYGITPLGRD